MPTQPNSAPVELQSTVLVQETLTDCVIGSVFLSPVFFFTARFLLQGILHLCSCRRWCLLLEDNYGGSYDSYAGLLSHLTFRSRIQPDSMDSEFPWCRSLVLFEIALSIEAFCLITTPRILLGDDLFADLWFYRRKVLCSGWQFSPILFRRRWTTRSLGRVTLWLNRLLPRFGSEQKTCRYYSRLKTRKRYHQNLLLLLWHDWNFYSA